ncbi:hypothetical protein KKE06_04050 [Candidatus Micrarchaeota archaeon]|nr:hypothetical protein [Candidatus Micrarchaeota archaeon]MBU1930770.1 hypothetical protein [Candidatus Micrarchaeota archaeon]
MKAKRIFFAITLVLSILWLAFFLYLFFFENAAAPLAPIAVSLANVLIFLLFGIPLWVHLYVRFQKKFSQEKIQLFLVTIWLASTIWIFWQFLGYKIIFPL